MTARKSSYRSLASLERDLARCRACVEAGYLLESLPVRAPGEGQRAYIERLAEALQVCPRDVPEPPLTANDHRQQQPANMKLARALNPRAMHGTPS